MIAKGGILHSYMFGRAQLKLQCVLLIHRRLDDVSCARVCVCVLTVASCCLHFCDVLYVHEEKCHGNAMSMHARRTMKSAQQP